MLLKLRFDQFRIPVGDVDRIEKRHPFFVPRHTKGLLHEGRPLGLERFSDKRHIGLLGRPATLASIAFVAGANDIFPDRGATLGARDDMVEIQLLPRQAPAAILTCAFVARVNIVTAKAHLALGNPVIAHQQNDPGDPNHTIDQADAFLMGRN